MSARLELSHKLHVLTRKEELDSVRLPGKVVVVLDILFATTTMVTALAHGAAEVVPVIDEAAARAEAARCREGCFVLAGELYADTLPGFAHPAPLALLEHGLEGKTVVYSTTNGTVAMTQAARAARVYCGALLNASELAAHIVRVHPRETVLIVCAGSANNFNFEDFYGAGYFVECFAALLGDAADFSDAARAARAVYRQSCVPEALLECRVGRMMQARGLRHEVEFACRRDAFPVVPALDEGRLRLVNDSTRSRTG
jgi:2-phosphosulfolactate phosphatase